MKHLSKQQIMHLHSVAIKKTGGLDGIRDEFYWWILKVTFRLRQIRTRILIQFKATDFSGFQCLLGQTLVESLSFREQIYKFLYWICTPLMFLELGVCTFLLGCALFSGKDLKWDINIVKNYL